MSSAARSRASSPREARAHRQVLLGSLFPGQPGTTSWRAPDAADVNDPDALRIAAADAEEFHLDFLFLPEGLRLVEGDQGIVEDKITGRPDSVTALAAVTAFTDRLGLVATLNSTYTDPYELARQLATLSAFAPGRIGWNVVTGPDAFTGENFRVGHYLDYADRYARAADVVGAVRAYAAAWEPDAVVADARAGRYLRAPVRPIDVDTPFTRTSGEFSVPRTPAPVIFQAGDSPDGRAFAAQHANGVYSPHSAGEVARSAYADIKARASAAGRDPAEVKVLPSILVAVGDTSADGREIGRELIGAQLSDATILRYISAVWGADLSDLDPRGALPTIDPDPQRASIWALPPGWNREQRSPQDVADWWRALSAERGWNIRDLAIALSSLHLVAGSASDVADEIVRRVDDRAADGFILIPPYVGRLRPILDALIPVLQERGAFRRQYAGATLLDHFAEQGS
jgi:FMN-dependent oxidoreductase (nitrilotriacetate monooxygenase family)